MKPDEKAIVCYFQQQGQPQTLPAASQKLQVPIFMR